MDVVTVGEKPNSSHVRPVVEPRRRWQTGEPTGPRFKWVGKLWEHIA
jgi:hypothetical protein